MFIFTRSSLQPQDSRCGIRVLLRGKIPEEHVRICRFIDGEESTVTRKCLQIWMINERHFLNFLDIFAGFQKFRNVQNSVVFDWLRCEVNVSNMRLESGIRINEEFRRCNADKRDKENYCKLHFHALPLAFTFVLRLVRISWRSFLKKKNKKNLTNLTF